tara:strand:+ start:598 stop:1800 length:1203 start_codon:yes stop_codon:yes gene_type:complete
MKRNPIINVETKKITDRYLKADNFSTKKNNPLLISSQNINEKIHKKIRQSFLKYNCENLEDKKIIETVLKSYEKTYKGVYLGESEFILKLHEIDEFFNLEEKDVIRYIIYRYKYNKFPLLKTLDNYPPCIQIEPTSVCNLRCIMCYQSDKTFSGKSNGFMGFMKFDLFKKIIDEIEGKIEAVTFASRGEPTLHPDLDKFLDYCKDKFLALKLNTNATLLNEKKIHSLLSSDLQQLVLSIDEKNKENYEKIRVNAKFEVIMKNLKMLKEIREKHYKKSKLRIRISGVKVNTNQSVDGHNEFYKEFADEVILVDYGPWESAYDEPVNDIKEPCSELYKMMYVWYDGKVNPCDYDYKSQLARENVKNNTIKSIWNSDYYSKLRDLHMSNQRNQLEPCKRCTNA